MHTPKARQATSKHYRDDPAESLPKGFDPFNFPMIARHWFGWRRPIKPSAEVIDISLIRLAAALHRLGEAIGIEVGSRKDMLERVAPRGHEVPR